MYSGPEPPSGGVSRPPLAVIAPHWTQFDGASSTVTVPSVVLRADLIHLRGAHVRPELARPPRGTRRSIRMWFGWSSRVLLPEAKTDESLSKVSLPSGAG